MIIRFPTGLYEDNGQIPLRSSDSGNITFTISSENPRETLEEIIQFPAAEELRQRPKRIFDNNQRRATFGELLFSIISASQTDPGSNRKSFAIGEFLEFTEIEFRDITTTEAPDLVDILHNTNKIDYDSLGLSKSDKDEIISASRSKRKNLEDQFVALQSEIKNLKSKIFENQKTINEVNSVISSVELLDVSDTIFDTLNDNLFDLNSERNDLIDLLNDKNKEVKVVYNQLIRVIVTEE